MGAIRNDDGRDELYCEWDDALSIREQVEVVLSSAGAGLAGMEGAL
jgi:hypothetical protein